MLASILLLSTLVLSGQEQRQGQFPGQQPTPTPQAQASPSPSPANQAAGQQRRPQEQPTPPAEEPPVVTKHEVRVGGTTMRYTATAGLMPIKNRAGEIEARMYFTSYSVDRGDGGQRRPLTFAFNCGPGSASVWLHMGAIGPRRVKMLSDGSMPAPPYELEDNQFTWLTQTDLVFIDPVGTGYSRAAKPELAQKFFSLQGDIESVGD